MSYDRSKYREMQEVIHEDYLNFRKTHSYVVIENVKVALPERHVIKKFAPKDFKLETTTVWSFPARGDWATHRGNYRGNWSPYIPRNLILRYTKKGELVLDQMVGSGTTAVECKLLQRRCIAVDINPDAVMVTRNRLDFSYAHLDEEYEEPEIRTYVGDARNLNLIPSESVDLIATHPPYAGIIAYSAKRVPGDLSSLKLEDYIEEMRKVAEECYRVLKPGKHCAVLIGDTRKHKHYVPIATRVLQAFLDAGFVLREEVIKLQWKMKTTRERWRGSYDFLLIAHEHLYIFRKLAEGEKASKYKASARW
jgi:DNA modification methylase